MKNIKKIIYWVLGSLLVVAQAIISAMLIISLIKMNVLETWIISLAVGLLVILSILCAVPLFIRKRSLIVMRILCVIISIACIGGGLFTFRYINSFNSFLDKTTTDEETISELDITKTPFVAYISGTDSRTDLENPEALSDVNILVVVNPEKEKILLASIPRDTYVQLHGTTGLKDKLTHAGRNNNIELSKATLEDFLDLQIDHTIRVSFNTVVEVVDELDGIEIYSDTALWLHAWDKTEPNKYCNYVVGTQIVDGDCALRFARERKSYYRGDRHRGENQQEVLTGIINKFLSSNDYLLRLPNILDIAADSFETSFSRDDITKFMRYQLSNHPNWQIESIGLDGQGEMLPTYSIGEDTPLWVMIPDEDSLAQVKNKINEYLGKETND